MICQLEKSCLKCRCPKWNDSTGHRTSRTWPSLQSLVSWSWTRICRLWTARKKHRRSNQVASTKETVSSTQPRPTWNTCSSKARPQALSRASNNQSTSLFSSATKSMLWPDRVKWRYFQLITPTICSKLRCRTKICKRLRKFSASANYVDAQSSSISKNKATAKSRFSSNRISDKDST